MENKTLIFLLLFLAVNINLVSSAEFDNVYTYDSETKTIVIENMWGLPLIGSELATATLTSPQHNFVAIGDGVLVGEFNFTPTDDSMDVFGELYLTNMKNGNSMSRGGQYKYKKYKEVSVDDYETVCEYVGNMTTQECIEVEVGSHMETQFDWIPIINPNNEFTGGVTYEIGIFVDVAIDDYGDWAPEIMGLRIEEWAVWSASLNVNLISFWKLDDNLGDTVVIDNQGNFTGTLTDNGNTDSISNATGIINRSLHLDGSNDYIETGMTPDIQFRSASVWFYLDDLTPAGTDLVLAFDGAAAGTYGNFKIEVSTVPTVKFNQGASSIVSSTLLTNGWHHAVMTQNATAVTGYLNGVKVGTLPQDGGNAGGTGSLKLGASGLGTNEWDGYLDEIGFWSRWLSLAEVEQLWNGGAGITWADEFDLDVNVISPLNITYNDSVTELTYNVSEIGNRCWFSDDGGASNSTDVEAGTNFTSLVSVPFVNAWTVYCNSSVGAEDSDTVVFFVNKSLQTTLLSPATGLNFTSTDINFSINSSPINVNLTNVTLFVWYDNGTEFLTNTTILAGQTAIVTNFASNISQGNFIWNAETCGTDVDCAFGVANRTFTIHTTPSEITILYPTGTIDFLEVGANLTLNWTIAEAGVNVSEHIINCSFLYNGGTTLLNQSQCIEINETSFLYVDGVNNLSFTVLEEFGLTTTNFTTWDFLFEKYNVTFESQALEGTQETFRAEVEFGDSSSISEAIFYYNNTNYTTSIIFSGGEYTILSSITIPLIDQDTNFTLGFYIVVGGTTYNLQSFQQEVISLNLSACGTRNDTVLNMSLFNEETKAGILGDIQINAQVISKTSGETIASTNASFTNVSSGAICLSPLEAYSNLFFSSEIRYVSTNFVPELYYIQLADMADYPRNLSLFDLATNDSTEFLVKYQDDTLIPVEGAIIQLQRRYISQDIYEVVEAPITSNSGTAVLHIDLNTNKYRASVVKDGVLLDFFDNIVFDCENELSGECTELLLGTIDPQNDVPLINLTDFTYSISSVNETITTTFVVPSGTPANINVVLTQLDQFGNETTCNQSVISSAGTIDCTFTETIGDSFLSLSISKDAELQAQQTYIVVEDSTLNFLGNNFFILLIIMLSLIGMAITSPEWMIINGVMVMLIGGALWLVNGMNFVMGLGSLVWLVISAIILIIKLAKQEDR